VTLQYLPSIVAQQRLDYLQLIVKLALAESHVSDYFFHNRFDATVREFRP
jgi:hypothetical protein